MPPSREETLAERVVAEAMTWLATPYRHQASAKGQGADCLGLVRGVYRALHGSEPETPAPYLSSPLRWDPGEPLLGAATRNLAECQSTSPGSVVLFRLRRAAPVSHCGIIVSTDRFIHAYRGRGVITSAWGSYWRHRLAATFVFPETP
ncbi:MAG: NlpC/P60 family protein [Pseudomonadota bacterium]